jgi:hypothetical protein
MMTGGQKVCNPNTPLLLHGYLRIAHPSCQRVPNCCRYLTERHRQISAIVTTLQSRPHERTGAVHRYYLVAPPDNSPADQGNVIAPYSGGRPD